MKETKMTEFTFFISGKIKVTLPGLDIDETYGKAKRKAVYSALQQIDEDWLDYVSAYEVEAAV